MLLLDFGHLGKGDLYAAEMQEEGIAIDESETLYNSMEELSVGETAISLRSKFSPELPAKDI